MNKTLRNILIVLGILIVLIAPIISSYNKIVSLDQNIKKAESNIDSDLQRRSDLIPNLVETVKGYAKQEKDIFTDIANARARLNGAQGVKDKANADEELTSAISRLLVVVERYPDLKSNENFRGLMVQLEGTENRINVARKDYNVAVEKYNGTIKKFPTSVIASIFRFEEKSYYKANEGAKEVPKVDFNIGK
ncbi:LemA protein [Clostridium tetanomorphum]|uniref:LemA family protein n=1 Tax=Clostridium tetanomorphum TaxID=1553 RepID=A0A923EEE3_CLOTT|nr:LemA family protein [Clostridium tetanomorphum]KAJ50417.1 lemA-like protein [Clostridium tetanomorphum DSM 665]MBC2399425.1 LemA family protein [Clostridium tetanomorphum]MBP1865768.1 LemA protein [Clostridium tetanomorphum]NRS86890.1 LemA protein [Clostridium tetanomorphum]NRZ99354.1 LemA protein [Clostridium tetanomorphum]